MIQRPQTLLLISASILLTISLFMPIWEIDTDQVQASLTSFSRTLTVDGETNTKNIAYVSIIGVVAVISILFSIFKYDNRALQMKISSVNNLLIGAHLILFIFIVIPAAEKEVKYEGDLSLGVYLAFGAFVLITVAKIFIKKDDNLIKSVDRIR